MFVFSQVIADIFNAPVYLKTVHDAAAVGAALRAKHGWLCAQQKEAKGSGGGYIPFSQLLGSSADGDDAGGVRDGLWLAASPREDAAAVYQGMAERYLKLEAEVKAQASSPSSACAS